MDSYSENFARCVRDYTNRQIEWLRTNSWTSQTNYINFNGVVEKLTYKNIPALAIDRCYRDYKMVHDIQTKCFKEGITGNKKFTNTGSRYRDCFLEEINKELKEFYKA